MAAYFPVSILHDSGNNIGKKPLSIRLIHKKNSFSLHIVWKAVIYLPKLYDAVFQSLSIIILSNNFSLLVAQLLNAFAFGLTGGYYEVLVKAICNRQTIFRSTRFCLLIARLTKFMCDLMWKFCAMPTTKQFKLDAQCPFGWFISRPYPL